MTSVRFAQSAVAAIGVTTILALAIACSDDPVPESCTDIPAGGCPRARGLACEDPTCQAVYLCRPNNVWELEETCPPRDASVPVGDPIDASLPPVVDASIDAPAGAFGGPGCEELQAPDCSLGYALACGTSCCGCEDLYVCESGGWTLWGSCREGGITQN